MVPYLAFRALPSLVSVPKISLSPSSPTGCSTNLSLALGQKVLLPLSSHITMFLPTPPWITLAYC